MPKVPQAHKVLRARKAPLVPLELLGHKVLWDPLVLWDRKAPRGRRAIDTPPAAAILLL